MAPLIHHYNLELLSDADCWSLFLEHAFQGRGFIEDQSSEFHDRVVAKCGGLPLVAKTLGGLLRSNREDAWDDILSSNVLNFPQQNGVLPVLQLSYHYLPSHLKRCFAYFALFPKDYEFNKTELVLLWMAEGIIQPRDRKGLEDWGSECFDALISRSIVQQSNNDPSKFTMHDLVHDLAKFVSRETILRAEGANKQSRRYERVRHSSYSRDEFDGKKKFEDFYKVEQLRTFLPILMREHYDYGDINYEVLQDLLPRFKKLRVLSLEGYFFTQLPISFEDFRLLKYLNLAGSAIRSLPESTSLLFNLQILILRDCFHLIKLPSKMRNLINLRHLDIEGADSLNEMPLGMKRLTNLQTLSNFILGKGGSVSSLKDLKNLTFLKGKLSITGLENLNELEDARKAELWKKQNLQALSLDWESLFGNYRRDEAAERRALNMLRPHENIKRLTIRNYGGIEFPLWIGDGSLSNMKVLTIENCENCRSLPSLGLLGSLKHLTIKGLTRLESINSAFFGEACLKPFQSLETLHFENMLELKYWNSDTAENGQTEIFSNLRELSIVGCLRLCGKLPDLLPSLEKLVVSNCPELVVPASSFPKLYKLEIDGCKGMVCSSSLSIDFRSIKYMTISNRSLEIDGCERNVVQ
ncbi:putative LRR and NB-ARC domains-containing disease resistance protein [Melia azedarach]|uniref:LRR and NB-ARC domains-containing disease resistance protein n=1 Tax=Melia azedarach TaxID=155640 RepID=A0ACC1YKN3_MELAZ|nr:putative LRR and NB-ARC domains-containing disease resistance protein [Melia azedarach]